VSRILFVCWSRWFGSAYGPKPFDALQPLLASGMRLLSWASCMLQRGGGLCCVRRPVAAEWTRMKGWRSTCPTQSQLRFIQALCTLPGLNKQREITFLTHWTASERAPMCALFWVYG
jgi:hypothetical protein